MVGRLATSWPTYPFASNVVIDVRGVFESDVDEERRGGEQVCMNLGDGTGELIALRGANGFPERDDVPRHGV